MPHVRVSISVALFVIANTVLEVDDQSAMGNFGIDDLELPALDSFTQPTTPDPNFIVALNNVAPGTGALDDTTPNTFPLDDFAPNKQSIGSVGALSFSTSDTSGVAEGLTAIGDPRNCTENLGKRDDSGLTIFHYFLPQPSIFTAPDD